MLNLSLALGMSLALLSAALFGGNHAFARKGLQDGEVYYGVFLTLILGIPLFSLGSLLTGELGFLAKAPVEGVLLFAVAGLLHFVLGRTLMYASLKRISTSRASPLVASNTLYSVAFSIVLLGEPFKPKVLLAAMLVSIGAYLVSPYGQGAAKVGASRSARRGFVYAIASSIIFGFTPLVVKMAIVAAPWPTIGILVSYTAAILTYLAPVLYGAEMLSLKKMNVNKSLVAAALCVNLGQLLRYQSLSLAPVSLVAPIMGSFPLFALALSFMLERRRDEFRAPILLGALAIILGLNLIYLIE